MSRKKYHKGLYKLKNPDKYVGDKESIVWRSLWELKMMRWADDNPAVLKWGSEIVVINYLYTVDKKVHRYFVDFAMIVKRVDGTVENLLIEIKPEAQTKPPVPGRNKERYLEDLMTWQKNQNKWTAATAWAKENNYTFMIMNEHDLGIK